MTPVLLQEGEDLGQGLVDLRDHELQILDDLMLHCSRHEKSLP
jgi:hypothetical protein